MLNNVVLMGRLVKNVDLRSLKGSNGDFSLGRFVLAVDRPKRAGQEKADTDFISCSAVGKKSEVINQYFKKGDLIVITGRWKTGSYEKDNKKYYTNEVDVIDFSFVPQKKAEAKENNASSEFYNVPDDYDGLPFN